VVSKAENKPNPDPHWVRDTLIEDYANAARVRGVSPAMADVEAVVMGDLMNYEAVQRNARPVAPKTKPAPSPKVGEVAKQAAGELGWQVAKRPLAPAKRKRFGGFLDRRPRNPKEAAAILRLGQILQPKSWFRPSKSFDYQLPHLAQKFTETMHALDRGLGEFEGKSEFDCERIVWRVVEDLCDKSTSTLGGWWVR
jgi:hypothetical protein